ncbi:MAG: acyltransferase [Parabacteroides sp.]
MEKQRNISLDWMRFVACILVILQHVTEYYYVSPEFTPHYSDNSILVGVFNSISRVSVPLFAMISGYLLLPMSQTTVQFFKRRFTRILYPFVLWSVVYSVWFALRADSTLTEWLQSVIRLPFVYQAEHLWYVYMLIGLYLLIPILSPWLKSVSKRELQAYLWLWLFTSFLPYLRLWIPSIGADIYFNPSPTFYYFSGFAGYLLLGHYIRRYNPFAGWQATVAIVVGWIVTSWVFLYQLSSVDTLPALELSWGFETFNVVIMTCGVFILLLKTKPSRFVFIDKGIISISTLSYGIYLCHVLWLSTYMSLFMPVFDNVLLVALCVVPCTFVSAYLTIFLLNKLPIAKYIC